MKGVLTLLRTMGDVVLANTLARNIKIAYPDLLLTVMVNEEYKDIVLGNPDISDVICPKDWNDCLHEMACNGYQKVFCPAQTTWEDNVWHQTEKYRHQNLVDFYADRCRIGLRDRRLIVYPQYVDGDPLPEGDIVAVHTTTLVKSKNWVGIGELIHRLRKEKVKVVQVGLPSDGTVESDFDLRGTLSLRQLIVYLSKCKWFIGMDSGLSFIAAASGIQTFVIQGPTIPETSGPFGPNVIFSLSPTRPECEVVRCHGNCRYPTEEPHESCINRLQVDMIWPTIRRHVCGY